MEKVNESLEQLTLESELKELKNSGNDCFKKGQFKASINFYKKAISVQGVGNKELALLHSNWYYCVKCNLFQYFLNLFIFLVVLLLI